MGSHQGSAGSAVPRANMKHFGAIVDNHICSRLTMSEELRAWVSFPGAPYTQASALRACKDILSPKGWIIDDEASSEAPPGQQLYLADYDLLPFEHLHPASYTPESTEPLLPQLSSYPIRKALIRKNYLAASLHAARLKKEHSTNITPATWVFEATYADDLDELLMDDLYDVREALENGEKWFIIKPAMADRGMGIRLFNSVDMLREIFDEFDDDESEEEGDERDVEKEDEMEQPDFTNSFRHQNEKTAVMMGQLRHFVVQVRSGMVMDQNDGFHTQDLLPSPLSRTTFAILCFWNLLEPRRLTSSTYVPTFWPREAFEFSSTMIF